MAYVINIDAETNSLKSNSIRYCYGMQSFIHAYIQ